MTQIVGFGARTPLGLSVQATAAAVRGGISRIAEHPTHVDHSGEFIRGAYDARLPPAAAPRERIVTMLKSSIEEFLRPLAHAQPRELVLMLALPEYRPGWTRDDEAFVLSSIRGAGGPWTIKPTVPARGHAGAHHAMQLANDLVVAGREQLLLVGGADTYFCGATLSWLAENRQLASDDVRSGFFPGEGACVLGLANAATVRELRVSARATVKGAHSSSEPRTRAGGEEVLGEGLSQAILNATGATRAEKRVVTQTYCDLNGERYRADEWAFAVLKTSFCFSDPTGTLSAPADLWGDVGAASGALHAMLAAVAWERRYAAGRTALLFGGSESGLRAATVVEAVDREGRWGA